MEISRYLAMTAAEMAVFSPPEGWHAAYMACHFSPYGTGLSNIPEAAPPDAMLIVNDRTPICGHDPRRIVQQLCQTLERLDFSCVLLDFQRPDSPETAALCEAVTGALGCPVGVSEMYASGLDCAVFLPPAPLDRPLEAHIAPWKGRELWLDVAPDAACITVTERGSSLSPLPLSPPPDNAFEDASLHCRYRAEVSENAVKFRLWRDLPQAEALLQEARQLGITKAAGLYQQLFT